MARALPDFYPSLPPGLKLVAAAEVGWTDKVRSLLDQGVSVTTTYSGRSVLQAAIGGVTAWGRPGYPETISLLLARGADPNREFPKGDPLSGYRPLYSALRVYAATAQSADKELTRRRRVIEVLLDFGAGLGRAWTGEGHAHPLYLAADHCDVDLVRRLLRTDLDLHAEGSTGPPIEMGCYNAAIVRLLLDHGAKPTPRFIKSVLRGHDARWKAEIANWLLDEGVNPRRYPFVEMAINWRDEYLLEHALTQGASPNTFVRWDVNFPLGVAAVKNYCAAVQVLLEYGAKTGKTWHKKTAAELARERGHTRIAQILEGAAPEADAE